MEKDTKIDFGQAIDLNAPIEIPDNPGEVIEQIPTEPTPDPEKNPIEVPKEDLIEVNVDEKTNDNTNKPSSEEPSSSNNTLNILAKALYEEGVLSSFEEKEEFGAEDLINLVKGEIDTNVNSYKDSLPKEVKKIIDNYEEGVSLKDLIEKRSDSLKYESITKENLLDSVELQKRIVKENLLERGISEDRITRRIKQFESLGDLEDEALDALADQVNISKDKEEKLIENDKARVKEAQLAAERQMEDLKNNIYDTEIIIPGMKLSARDKDEVYKSMTEVVSQDAQGNALNKVMVTREKNPLAFEKAIHYYHSLGLFDIDEKGSFNPDFSKINKVSKSSAIEELTKLADTNRSLSSGQPKREVINRDVAKSNVDAITAFLRNMQ